MCKRVHIIAVWLHMHPVKMNEQTLRDKDRQLFLKKNWLKCQGQITAICLPEEKNADGQRNASVEYERMEIFLLIAVVDLK